jgi:hypothetical protein
MNVAAIAEVSEKFARQDEIFLRAVPDSRHPPHQGKTIKKPS